MTESRCESVLSERICEHRGSDSSSRLNPASFTTLTYLNPSLIPLDYLTSSYIQYPGNPTRKDYGKYINPPSWVLRKLPPSPFPPYFPLESLRWSNLDPAAVLKSRCVRSPVCLSVTCLLPRILRNGSCSGEPPGSLLASRLSAVR